MHLDQGLQSLNFVPSPNQPRVYFRNDMVIVYFVDDTLFFGKDGKKIDEVIKKLEEKGFTLTREDTKGNVFTFLRGELNKINRFYASG